MTAPIHPGTPPNGAAVWFPAARVVTAIGPGRMADLSSGDEQELFDQLWRESDPAWKAEVDERACVVCGNTDTEQHHWAPQALFPEPDWWVLTVALCTEHHHEWHRRMRAHGLRWPHELAQV